MATLLELRSLRADEGLLQKIEAAVMVAAETIRNESPATGNHANRIIWAKQAFQNPPGKTPEMLAAVLAANESATVANIQGASDAAIQTNIDAAVDVFADGS